VPAAAAEGLVALAASARAALRPSITDANVEITG
jgi:hypothetical protein